MRYIFRIIGLLFCCLLPVLAIGEELRQDVAGSDLVMPNPYDSIQSIQENSRSAGRVHADEIEAMSRRVRRGILNPDAALRDQVARLMHDSAEIKRSDILDLLNLDAGDVSIERIPVQRGGDISEIPSISMADSDGFVSGGAETANTGSAEIVFLENWEVLRNDSGGHIVGRIGDPSSRLLVHVGMILEDYGQVIALRSHPDAYYLVLEGGMRIAGRLEDE